MRFTGVLVAVAALLRFASAAGAQVGGAAAAPQDTVACDDQRINSITINTLPPAAIARSSSAIRRVALSILFQASTTEEHVARAFLLVKAGDRCNRGRLDEAMRVLRAQPFISSASVRTLPDTGGGVRLEVETLDEIPVVIGGSLGDGLSALTLGNSNLGGYGLKAVARWRQGGFYRDAFGLELRKHALFGKPIVLSIDALRRSLGQDVSASLSTPFYSNLQRFGWYAGIRETRNYENFVRADDDPLSLEYKRLNWSVGGVARIGGRNIGIFAGPIAMFERGRPATDAVAVTDSGPELPDSDELHDRYGDVTTFRAGGALGVRLLTYTRVSGFDALLGEQDIARGLQIGVVAARGIEGLGAGDLNDYGSVDLYAGVGGGRTFAAVRGTVEGQRPRDADSWESVVAGMRAAAYYKPSERRTWELSVEYSGGWRESVPLQLSLGQKGGGPRGYEGSGLPGGRRVVARFEERRAMGAIGRYMHWGLAAFVDGARVWSGDVPFGVDLNMRGSAGISLLAAIPPQSRRLLRVDVAVPFTGDAEKDWRVTVSARDVTRIFWREPRDVTRSRVAALPASMFGWP
jgi:hypothetical protein